MPQKPNQAGPIQFYHVLRKRPLLHLHDKKPLCMGVGREVQLMWLVGKPTFKKKILHATDTKCTKLDRLRRKKSHTEIYKGEEWKIAADNRQEPQGNNHLPNKLIIDEIKLYFLAKTIELNASTRCSLLVSAPRMKIAVAVGVVARRQTATKRAIHSVAGIHSGVAVWFEILTKKIWKNSRKFKKL